MLQWQLLRELVDEKLQSKGFLINGDRKYLLTDHVRLRHGTADEVEVVPRARLRLGKRLDAELERRATQLLRAVAAVEAGERDSVGDTIDEFRVAVGVVGPPALGGPMPPSGPDAPGGSQPTPTDLQQHLDQQEREILVRTLHETGFNRTAAAARLGLSLRQIRYRIARLNIDTPQGNESNDEAG